jgi:hypothetical protein
MCGAYDYDLEYKKELISKNYILDDTGDTISHLNDWFGELTGTYWIWKNTNHEYVGTNQYRIFWETTFLKINDNSLYVAKKVNVSTAVEKNIGKKVSIFDQYGFCHGYENLKLLYDLCNIRDIPLKSTMIDQLKSDYNLTPFNMFIAESKIFNKICEILFDILFAFYDSYKDLLPDISTKLNQHRILDFLSERILHMIYSNINYYMDGVKIVELDIRTYEKYKT